MGGKMAASLILGNTVFLSFSLLSSHMFSIFEVVSGYMRTIVLLDNMFIFQEGRIRKPGKLKGKKSHF